MDTTALLKENRHLIAWIFVLLFVVLALVVALAFRILTSKEVPITCSSFDSYWEAEKAFRNNQGVIVNPQLDGDHDGIPCEGLLNGGNAT